MTALDIAERQVLIDYFDDPNFHWHGRILLVALPSSGKWIAASPDLEIEVLDLSSHRILPLVRSGPIPARVHGNVYFFDPLTAEQLQGLRAEAAALAQVLGAVDDKSGTLGDSVVLFADPGRPDFGQEVGGELLVDGTCIVRGSCALIDVNGVWVLAQRVRRADATSWKADKLHGPGRDVRLAPEHLDAGGAHFVNVNDAISHLRDITLPDWPFEGPKAVKELVVSIRAVGGDVFLYHDTWVRRAGVSPDSPFVFFHRALVSVLYHLISFDQLDVYQVAGAELVARYVVFVERSVLRNPKAPDAAGLGVVIQSQLDGLGQSMNGGAFLKFVAEAQKTEAFTLKQQRLFAEEVKGSGGGGGGGGGGANPKTGPKPKAPPGSRGGQP